MGRAEALIALRQALSVDPELELLDEPGELQRHSRDAFEYSPVLTPRLEACRAELVVRPRTVMPLNGWLRPAPSTRFP